MQNQALEAAIRAASEAINTARQNFEDDQQAARMALIDHGVSPYPQYLARAFANAKPRPTHALEPEATPGRMRTSEIERQRIRQMLGG